MSDKMNYGKRSLSPYVGVSVSKKMPTGEIVKGGLPYDAEQLAGIAIRRFCWGGQVCESYVAELKGKGLTAVQIAASIEAMAQMNAAKRKTKGKTVFGIRANQKPYRMLPNGQKQMRPLSVPMGRGRYTKGWRFMLPSRAVYLGGKTAVGWLKGVLGM